MSSSAPNPDPELTSAIRLSLLRAARRIRQQKVHTEVTWSQLSALATVFKLEPTTATAVAARERVQPPSMTKILATLESNGLIVRAPHPDDRRSATISLTPAGQKVLDDENRAREEWLADRLAGLSKTDRDLLRRVIPVLDRLAEE